MAEHGLDAPKVGAGIEKMRGVAMPQRVRVKIGAHRAKSAPFSEDVLNLARRETRAVASQKKRLLVLMTVLTGKRRARREIRLGGLLSLLAEGHDSLFSPLPKDPQLPLSDVDIAQ